MMRELRFIRAFWGSLAVPGVSFVLAVLAGCGLVYQAASGYRAHKMSQDLSSGQTMTGVHAKWGEPDLRAYPDERTEIWSYATHANTDDVAATLLYTSAKAGDTGSFLDLKFIDGRLASWQEARHTMPPKEGPGFTAGIANPGALSYSGHY